jgi:hypothetical protein
MFFPQEIAGFTSYEVSLLKIAIRFLQIDFFCPNFSESSFTKYERGRGGSDFCSVVFTVGSYKHKVLPSLGLCRVLASLAKIRSCMYCMLGLVFSSHTNASYATWSCLLLPSLAYSCLVLPSRA